MYALKEGERGGRVYWGKSDLNHLGVRFVGNRYPVVLF